MIREETFKRTVDILVSAYFKGTLVNGSGCGCAVGNILANSNGYDVVMTSGNLFTSLEWKDPVTGKVMDSSHWDKDDWWFDGEGTVNPECSLLPATGYTAEELGRIEHAFENYERGTLIVDGEMVEEIMFKGLMNVMDVLFGIHHVEEEQQEQYKQKFVTA